MKKQLKALLYRTVGLENYLKILHLGHGKVIDWKLFKDDNSFITYHMLPKLLQKGDKVVDIGANLGYFSRLMLKCVGKSGHVYSVEPVKPFFKTLSWALGKASNITLYNYALGTESKHIQLSIPDNVGYIRTGLPKVVEQPIDDNQAYKIFEAEMVRGSELLSAIPKIDFIKCDIEGFEQYVIPELEPIIAKHLPVLQIETSAETMIVVDKTLIGLGYEKYVTDGNHLYKYLKLTHHNNDFYYIHPSKLGRYNTVIKGDYN